MNTQSAAPCPIIRIIRSRATIGCFLLLTFTACRGAAPPPPPHLTSYESLSPEKMELIHQLETQRDILKAQNIMDFVVSEDEKVLYFLTTPNFEALTNDNKILLIEVGMYWKSLEETGEVLLLNGGDYHVITSYDKLGRAYREEE